MSGAGLRQLPAVDAVLAALPAGAADYDHRHVVAAVRAELDAARARLAAGEELPPAVLTPAAFAAPAYARLRALSGSTLRPAVNGTGVIMHSGLGRALQPAAAQRALADATRGYVMLAMDPETGKRCSRDVHVEKLVCALTGAEAATIVNNNAVATMLILAALARGREVVVSRGELVEIGGSFRIPDVMAESGAVLREVGTTNKTHAADYANAIGVKTAALLRVHQSNYRIVGFTAAPALAEIVAIARQRKVLVIDDIGSGALLDISRFGLEKEPMPQESIAAGADLVCFSGDKLIGGPQCGIIIGRRELIAKIKKHPFARMLRVDKLIVASLQATLELFLSEQRLLAEHPVYRLLAAEPVALRARAEKLAVKLQAAGVPADVVDCQSQVGSGAVPAQQLPSAGLCIRPPDSADAAARALRRAEPAVVLRIADDQLICDMRTVLPDEDAVLGRLLVATLSRARLQSV